MRIILSITMILFFHHAWSSEHKQMDVNDFVEKLKKYDPEAEEILSEKLRTNFLVEQGLPTDVTLLTILQEYGFNTNSSDQTSTLSAEIGKEFLQIGTTVNVSKTINERPDREEDVTSIRINQDLWRNFLGRGTRLRRSSLNAQRDALELQVAEAYEDYLFERLSEYIDLKKFKTELDILQKQYEQALALEKNIQDRLRQSIASTTDLSRAKIQTMNRKELVLEAKAEFFNLSQRLSKLTGEKADYLIVPVPLDFKKTLSSITKDQVLADSNRQLRLIELRESSATFDLEYRRDLARPRVNLVAGYTNDDSKRFSQTVQRKEAVLGFRLDVPFGDSNDRAAIAQSHLELTQAKLAARRELRQLEQTLEASHRIMKSLQEQLSLALERTKLAEVIAKEDERRYLIGRLTLENLLDTKEALFTSQSRVLVLQAELNREVLNWLRLKDQLLVQFDQSV